MRDELRRRCPRPTLPSAASLSASHLAALRAAVRPFQPEHVDGLSLK